MAARDIHSASEVIEAMAVLEAIEAREAREAAEERALRAEVPPPTRDSGIRPVAPVDLPALADLPTVPPPRMRAARVHAGFLAPRRSNGPYIDEVLYRLSVGDVAGAERASELLDGVVPIVAAPHAVVGDPPLRLAEAWILALVDGKQTCGDVLASSPFAKEESLASLCELVDRGLVILG